nr:10667_t:CDS:2 [Entrophospora candida]
MSREEIEGTRNYCQEHGCIYCSYQNRGEKISAVDETSLVCKSCQNKDLEKAFKNSKELKKLENEDLKTRTLLLGLNSNFLKDISEILGKIKNRKRAIISKNTDQSATITDNEINNFFLKTIEAYHSDIEAELSNSSPVKIAELDSKFHNYKDLSTNELEIISNDIFEAIKNKRAKKELTDLIRRIENCSDSDLLNFIQELEKFSSISPYKKNAYLAHQNKADSSLEKLRQRWNDLDEKEKLQSLGSEQKSEEYQVVDRSETFEEVKMAREEIKQGRQKKDDNPSIITQNSNELASKALVGITVAIAGSTTILVLVITHFRHAFVGNTLANVYQFCGYKVVREYYINDRGGQITALRDLEKCGVKFDIWFSESSLYEKNKHQKILTELGEKELIYSPKEEKAIFFRSSLAGDDKDRVIIKQDGDYTYFFSDILYLLDKLQRADKLIYEGQMERFSKRTGNTIELAEALEYMDMDQLKFFLLEKEPNQPLAINVELLKKDKEKTQLYYIQYAHARCHQIFKKAQERGIKKIGSSIDLLKQKKEREIFKLLVRFSFVLEKVIEENKPHHLIHYLYELAQLWQIYYQNSTILEQENKELTSQKLLLVKNIQIILKLGLKLMGIEAPERM